MYKRFSNNVRRYQILFQLLRHHIHFMLDHFYHLYSINIMITNIYIALFFEITQSAVSVRKYCQSRLLLNVYQITQMNSVCPYTIS